MPIDKTLQKSFCFSSPKNKFFVERRIADLTNIHDWSTSYIIEKSLLNYLAPSNPLAKAVVTGFLYSDDGRACDAVSCTLWKLFSANSEERNGKPLYGNFKPLLEFCLTNCQPGAHCIGNEGEIHRFASCLDTIIEQIKNCANSCIDIQAREDYSRLCLLAQDYFNEAKARPESITFRFHYQLMLDLWDMVKDFPRTYAYLSELTSMDHSWRNDAETRTQLYNIIDSMSHEWDQGNGCHDDGRASDEGTYDHIQFNYTDSTQFSGAIEVTANGAKVGVIQHLSAETSTIEWFPGSIPPYAIKFAFRSGAVFDAVANELNRFKEQQGYERLVISDYKNGIVDTLGREFVEAHDFGALPGGNPNLFFYG